MTPIVSTAELNRAIDWLVSQGYAERVTINGEDGVRVTDAGRTYLARKSVH